MSVRTILVIAAILLLLLGASKFFGYLQVKRGSQASYLEETVGATLKVREMKDERSELLRKHEEMIEAPE